MKKFILTFASLTILAALANAAPINIRDSRRDILKTISETVKTTKLNEITTTTQNIENNSRSSTTRIDVFEPVNKDIKTIGSCLVSVAADMLSGYSLNDSIQNCLSKKR